MHTGGSDWQEKGRVLAVANRVLHHDGGGYFNAGAVVVPTARQ